MADVKARVPFVASAYEKLIDTGAGDGSYARYSVNVQLISRISASFTRPADTNVYAIGDLVANNTVAGSVAPLVFALARTTMAGGRIRRARLQKSGVSIINASFRLHLYSASPTCVNGDNGAWSTDKSLKYVGSIDFTFNRVFTDGAVCIGVPNDGVEINLTADTYYGLLEARGIYTPVSAESFNAEFEVWPN